MEQQRACLKCGAQLEKEVTEEPDPEDGEPDPDARGSDVCRTVGCALKGRIQPQGSGSTYGLDTGETLQVGAVPVNERNLPRAMACLQHHFSGFDVTKVDGPESGADIVLNCRGC